MKRNGRRARVPGFDEPLPAPVVIGLDLSLRFTCCVAVPGGWKQDWSKVRTMRTGESLRKDAPEWERVRRLVRIEADVVEFIRSVRGTHAVIEQYAYTAEFSHAHSLGELGGAIKVALQRDLNISFECVAPASARKLLGKQPRANPKEWSARRLLAAGAPHDWIGASEDRWGVFDAFALANFALSEHRCHAIVMQQELCR